jgi:hypothetical protein
MFTSRFSHLVLLAAILLPAILLPRVARGDVTDIVFVIDVTGDMAGEVSFLQSALPGVNDQFLTLGDDVRYSLVEFSGTSALTQNLADYNTFAAPGGAWDSMTTDPLLADEFGSLAILSNHADVDFRYGSKRHVVLVTSEPDGSSAADKAAAALIFNDMGPAFWLLHSTTDATSVRNSYIHLSANAHSFSTDGQPLHFQYEAFQQLGWMIHEQNAFTPAVPEPGSALLLVGAMAAGLLRRRRR